jgi:hypothetical protein
MNRTIVGIVAVLIGSLSLAAARGADDATLLKERLAIKEKIFAVEKELTDATAEDDAKALAIGDALAVVSGPPLKPEDILQREKELAEARLLVQALEEQLELAKIKDGPAREAKARELEEARDKQLTKIDKMSAPFQRRIETIRKALEPTAREWEEALGKYLKAGEGKYADLGGPKLSSYSGSSVQAVWSDAKGQVQVRVSLTLESGPARIPTTRPAARWLDDKFQINETGGKSLGLRVGYFQVYVRPVKKEWGEDTKALGELAKALIDLDKLGALKPEP